MATLDLMLTNRPTFFSKCSPVPGFGDHDTAALVNKFCHPQCHKPIQRKNPCWNRTDFTALRNEVKERCVVKQSHEHHVPIVTTSKRFNQPWFNQMCKRAVRKKPGDTDNKNMMMMNDER